jgi:hypothetical protein
LLANHRREFHCFNRDAAAFEREQQDVAGLIRGVERQRDSWIAIARLVRGRQGHPVIVPDQSEVDP